MSHRHATALPRPGIPRRNHPSLTLVPCGSPRQAPADCEPGPKWLRAMGPASNLAIAILTIGGVCAFYALLLLGVSHIATNEHRSPYADFYAKGQNPWAQTMVSTPPTVGTSTPSANLRLVGPTP